MSAEGGVLLPSMGPRFHGSASGSGLGMRAPRYPPPQRPPPQMIQPPNQNDSFSPNSAMFQPYYLRPAYRFKPTVTMGTQADVTEPGRRLRNTLSSVRRQIDTASSILSYLEKRCIWKDASRVVDEVQPDLLYSANPLPPTCFLQRPIDCVMSRFVRAAMNKIKCPIYDICWTPEGRRLITGASTGEFTLWNGIAFNFETILQAHDTAIRCLKWCHNDEWLVSADHDGFVKYWQANMNNVHMYQAHKETIRSLSFSPTDTKLATASDDGTVRVWDFARCLEERIMRGHGSDVRSIDWHPQMGLLVSGSRDSQQPVKIWDPKTGQCLATLHDHKNAVMAVQWNKNGNWMVTGSRDHLIKLYDIRMMREVQTFRGHKKEVTSLAWHPFHEGLLVSGGGDGSLMYWNVTHEKELGVVEHAHDQAVWSLQWHPLGHVLASGSNDNNTKFWSRNKPGDLLEDFHGMMGTAASGASSQHNASVPQSVSASSRTTDSTDEPVSKAVNESGVIPGMGGLEGDLLDQLKAVEQNQNFMGATEERGAGFGAKKTLIKQPPPKKAQTQFERMWNVSKAPASSQQDQARDNPENDANQARTSKPSLLGPPPPRMVQSEPITLGPPGPGGPWPPMRPPMHLNMRPANNANMPMHRPPINTFPFNKMPPRSMAPPNNQQQNFNFGNNLGSMWRMKQTPTSGGMLPTPGGVGWGASAPPPPSDVDYRANTYPRLPDQVQHPLSVGDTDLRGWGQGDEDLRQAPIGRPQLNQSEVMEEPTKNLRDPRDPRKRTAQPDIALDLETGDIPLNPKRKWMHDYHRETDDEEMEGALNYERDTPNYERDTPNYERDTPNYERDTPNYERDTPNYERDTPNYERDTPNYERDTPNYERDTFRKPRGRGRGRRK